jgi:hypothetical protein
MLMISAAVFVYAAQVLHVEGNFSEEQFGALLFQFDHFAQDGSGGSGAELAVFGFNFGFALVAEELEHLFEILEVEQGQVAVVAVFEHHGYHAALGVVEAEDTAEQHRAEFAYGSTQARALLAGEGEELHAVGGRAPGDANFGGPIHDFWVVGTRHGYAGRGRP